MCIQQSNNPYISCKRVKQPASRSSSGHSWLYKPVYNRKDRPYSLLYSTVYTHVLPVEEENWAGQLAEMERGCIIGQCIWSKPTPRYSTAAVNVRALSRTCAQAWMVYHILHYTCERFMVMQGCDQQFGINVQTLLSYAVDKEMVERMERDTEGRRKRARERGRGIERERSIWK